MKWKLFLLYILTFFKFEFVRRFHNMAAASDESIMEYRRMTQEEHIKTLSDTYIGSSEPEKRELMVLNEEGKIISKEINVVMGLYKIFDEILVNITDHITRTRMHDYRGTNKVTKVSITFETDPETGKLAIIMENNGDGIDIDKFKDPSSGEEIFIPQMVFGVLLTSTNYRPAQNQDQSSQERKIYTGGKNGFGAKLTNLFSKHFEITTIDANRKKIYHQIFRNNMEVVEPPKIKACSTKPYTRIRFIPDYSRFGVDDMNNDMKMLFYRRVYDAAACAPSSVTFSLNGEKIKLKGFVDYAKLYMEDTPIIAEVPKEEDAQWGFAVTTSPAQFGFRQVSFVNMVSTLRGGKHVDHVVNQIVSKIREHIKKNKKKDVKPPIIKENIWIFVRAMIPNPAFDSQTKEELTTPVSKFASKADVTDAFVKKFISQTDILSRILDKQSLKDDALLQKNDGKMTNRIFVPKLEDANHAGRVGLSKDCTLILTEGDSAKTFAISGLSIIGRDKFGVFPLRGKPINVRDINPQKLDKNEEFAAIKKIMGLQQSCKYDRDEDINRLRYGKILILTDADVDGAHIKGLIINMFQVFWPNLLSVPGFIQSMSTPILKVSRGSQKIPFYSIGDYEVWRKQLEDSGRANEKWTVKYYKGLGTSTAAEAKEYFSNFAQHQVIYHFDPQETNSLFQRTFDKKMADQRKEWLSHYDRNRTILPSKREITCQEFIDDDFIHFSHSDNIRSIPSLVDGFKPSQRKIIFAAFERNLKHEIKVAQFAGFVSEKTSYHHGEKSLMDSIIKMAQDFPGSNNIWFLKPIGQFGTRLQGGKDMASPRYIFTQLDDITQQIFLPSDKFILNYLDDDGTPIEPEFYLPIIPMIVVNGVNGIGTGYNTNIPPHCPVQVAEWLLHELEQRPDLQQPLLPHVSGFFGDIIQVQDKMFSVGKVQPCPDIPSAFAITELPIGVWTEPFLIKFRSVCFASSSDSEVDPTLRNQLKGIISIDTYSSEKAIFIICRCSSAEVAQQFLEPVPVPELDNAVYPRAIIAFHLFESKFLNSSHMHCYNADNHIVRFNSIYDIIRAYIPIRIQGYSDRRSFLINKFKLDLDLLNDKIRFVEGVISDQIRIFKVPRSQIIHQLDSLHIGHHQELLNMNISQFTEEKMNDLFHSKSETQQQLDSLTQFTPIQMWISELKPLINVLRSRSFDIIQSYNTAIEEISNSSHKKRLGPSKSSSLRKKSKK